MRLPQPVSHRRPSTTSFRSSPRNQASATVKKSISAIEPAGPEGPAFRVPDWIHARGSCYPIFMTRIEYISLITTRLASANDEMLAAFAELAADKQQVLSVADIVTSMTVTDTDTPVRDLTPHELALIEQSKADFKAGRTLSSAETRRSIDDFLAPLGVPRSAA